MKKFILRIANFAHRLALPSSIWTLWLVTLLYYASLIFVNSNLGLFIATAIYVGTLALLRHSLLQALWLSLLATTLIMKGKTWEITLIPKELAMNAVFDVNVIVPFYIGDALLIGLCIQMWRLGLWQRGTPSQRLWLPLTLFVLFIANTIWPSWQHVYGEVILLISAQLIPLLVLLAIPSYIFPITSTSNKPSTSLSLKASSYALLLLVCLTQVGWAMVQYWLKSPIGSFIEGKLPGFEQGVWTNDTGGLFRSTGWFADSAILGTFLLAALTACMWYSRTEKNAARFKMLSLSIALLTVGILVSLNRVLIVSAGIAICIWLLDLYRRNQHSISRFIQVGLLVLVIASVPVIATRFSNLSGSLQPYGSGWYRLEQAMYVGRIVQLYPFGVGLGLSQLFFAQSFPGESMTIDPAYPHNIWLQLIAETGVVGTALYGLLIIIIYQSWITGRSKLTAMGVSGLAYLFCAQFYPIFINQSELFRYFFIALGWYIAEQRDA